MLQKRAALAALIAASAAARTAAADTVVAPDPRAGEVTALDGTIVWVSGEFGAQTLWQRSGGVVSRVKGAPRVNGYRTIDLGRDSKNRLVLTYARCNSKQHCSAIQDDLNGSRTGFKHLEIPRRCNVTYTPVRWRSNTAYGLSCRDADGIDTVGRSGVIVKSGSRAPKRMPRPAGARKNGLVAVAALDLRGGSVAAVIGYSPYYAFVQTTGGKRRRAIVAGNAQDGFQDSVAGIAVGSGATMYVLTHAERLGEPNRAILFRVGDTCYETETFVNPPGLPSGYFGGFRAADVAVDGATVYLVVPGVGIVEHDFTPAGPCMPLLSG